MTRPTTKLALALTLITALGGCAAAPEKDDIDAVVEDSFEMPLPESHGGCEQAGTDVVFVLDTSAQLHRYDPAIVDASAFSFVGQVDCGAGITPNSMSVGRDGFAYVAFLNENDGACAGVYQVSLEDGSCQSTTAFQCGAHGFGQFGMGFVADGPQAETDSLYIGAIDSGALGRVDLAAGTTDLMGTMANSGAEFTGNALGELWAFVMYAEPPVIRQIDKHSGATIAQYDLSLPAPQGDWYTWAFAHWGGYYHVFYYDNAIASSSHVYRLDPATGDFTHLIGETGLEIVGAGVSTCAPVEPPK